MRPCRFLLSFLALVGSLDIGFSFANANKSPLPSTATRQSAVSFVRPPVTTAPAMASTLRQRKKPTDTALNVSGGASSSRVNTPEQPDYKKLSVLLTSLWGSGGVIYILAKAIKRVVPIALEPFQEGAVPLSQVQLGIYLVTCLWFAYVEGYKGFQTKFSPLVVKRSLTLVPGTSGIHHILLAPLYSMGLFHASKKRKIVSWSVTIGVAAIVAAVKRLPYPWRNIVDAGVVAGLTWGSLSIIAIYCKAWMLGKPPAIDPAMPE
ncbi:expressed unknown protein [Seminavis robusta]|uniref:Uncharacterized protein n=1 Tax=Seminavis robusta TaxID=568900 RepID=A0A9N8E769_9STRA|nr:expressed unknown protein [Seminavis robusta]|eukprot:Sro753_g197330.1 n/a (263) ;mRNA; r:15213-16092